MSGGSEPDPGLSSSKPPADVKTQWKMQVVNAAGAVRRLDHANTVNPLIRRAESAAGKYPRKADSKRPNKVNLPQLDFTRCCGLDDYLQAEDSAHEVLKITHKALVERLNMYGFVLVLLGSITFVAILQPPGGFDDNGHIRPGILVSCFMFFATLSFLLTFIGLFGVVVGYLSLFRPAFFLKVETRVNSKSGSSPQSSSFASKSSSLLYNPDGMDDLTVLAKLLWDNLERMWRLRIYLIVSLALIVCAFGCGVFVVIGSDENRNRYLLAGAIFVGLVALVFEVFRTAQGINKYHKSKWLHTIQNSFPNADLPLETPGEKLGNWLEGITKGTAPSRRSNLEPTSGAENNV